MHGDNHRVLVFTGLLECLELAAQQCGRHITVLALHDPRVDHMLVVCQKDETDSLPAADCDLPVARLRLEQVMMPGSCAAKRSSIQRATARSQGSRSRHQAGGRNAFFRHSTEDGGRRPPETASRARDAIRARRSSALLDASSSEPPRTNRDAEILTPLLVQIAQTLRMVASAQEMNGGNVALAAFAGREPAGAADIECLDRYPFG